MEERVVIEFLLSHDWTFAKSMPTIPHWYIVKNRSSNYKAFEAVVDFIQRNGTPKRFGKVTYKYFVHGGFQYWTMGYPPNETTIINRAEI